MIEPGWLTEMVRQAARPEIGAVGAKLLYPDRTIQHGGIVLGIDGVAGHSHLGMPDADPGYFARMVLAHEVSAVTGACLAMRAAVFAEVGGFDAQALKVAFNDVDLCLRIREAGYRIVWTPFAKLIHHESKSRGPEDTPEKKARFEAETRVMLGRWARSCAPTPITTSTCPGTRPITGCDAATPTEERRMVTRPLKRWLRRLLGTAKPPPGVVGHVDIACETFVKGWALDTADRDRAIGIEILHHGAVVARGATDIARDDVAKAGHGKLLTGSASTCRPGSPSRPGTRWRSATRRRAGRSSEAPCGSTSTRTSSASATA